MQIIKTIKNGKNIFSVQPSYNFNIIPGLSPKIILESLETRITSVTTENYENAFKKQSALEIIQDLSKVLEQNQLFYENPEFMNFSLMRKQSFSNVYGKESRDSRDSELRILQSSFYGKYGIIRCFSTIFSLKTDGILSNITFIDKNIRQEIEFQASLTPQRYEPVLIQLLLLIKTDENFKDYKKILDLLVLLNKNCPEMLPNDILILVLNKIIESQTGEVQNMSLYEGKLGIIARDLLSAIRKSKQALYKAIKIQDLLRLIKYASTEPKTYNLRI